MSARHRSTTIMTPSPKVSIPEIPAEAPAAAIDRPHFSRHEDPIQRAAQELLRAVEACETEMLTNRSEVIPDIEVERLRVAPKKLQTARRFAAAIGASSEANVRAIDLRFIKDTSLARIHPLKRYHDDGEVLKLFSVTALRSRTFDLYLLTCILYFRYYLKKIDSRLKSRQRQQAFHTRPMMDIWRPPEEEDLDAIAMLADRCTALYALMGSTYSQIVIAYSNFITKDNDKERAFFEYYNQYIIGVMSQLFEQEWWPIFEKEYYRFIKTEWFSSYHHQIQQHSARLVSPLLIMLQEEEQSDKDARRFIIKDRPRTGPLVCIRALKAHRPPPPRIERHFKHDKKQEGEQEVNPGKEVRIDLTRPATAVSEYPKPKFDSDTISARARNVGNVPYRWRKLWSTKVVADQEIEKERARFEARTGEKMRSEDLKKRVAIKAFCLEATSPIVSSILSDKGAMVMTAIGVTYPEAKAKAAEKLRPHTAPARQSVMSNTRTAPAAPMRAVAKIFQLDQVHVGAIQAYWMSYESEVVDVPVEQLGPLDQVQIKLNDNFWPD